MAQALIERSCELRVLRQQLVGQVLQQKNETSIAQIFQKDQLDEVSVMCKKAFCIQEYKEQGWTPEEGGGD